MVENNRSYRIRDMYVCTFSICMNMVLEYLVQLLYLFYTSGRLSNQFRRTSKIWKIYQVCLPFYRQGDMRETQKLYRRSSGQNLATSRLVPNRIHFKGTVA